MERKDMRAGGFLIALGTIVGTLVGGTLGQPSAGLLCGFGAGSLAAVLIWLRDRRHG